MDQVFEKYEMDGAYHWTAAIDRGRWRNCPQLNARYDIPLDIVSDALTLAEARGLDVGCGDGVLIYKVRRLGGFIEGLDYSEAGLRLAQQKLAEYGVATAWLTRGSCYQMPFPDDYFDYVTAAEIVERLDNPRQALSEIARVLRPGGVFVCTTPNGERQLPADVARDSYHEHEFSPHELRDLLVVYFESAKVSGCGRESLDRLYRSGAGSRLLKLMSASGINLFRRVRSRREPSERWTTLIGAGRGRRAPVSNA